MRRLGATILVLCAITMAITIGAAIARRGGPPSPELPASPGVAAPHAPPPRAVPRAIARAAMQPTGEGAALLPVRLEDRKGKPLGLLQATIELHPGGGGPVARALSVTADEEGEALLRLPPGRWELLARAEHRYGEPVPVDLAPGENALVWLPLAGGGFLEATVAGPLAGARVEAYFLLEAHGPALGARDLGRMVSGRSQARAEAAPDAAGRARLGPLEPGDYRVVAYQGDFARAEATAKIAPEEATAVQLVLDAQPETTLVLRAVDASRGEPLSGRHAQLVVASMGAGRKDGVLGERVLDDRGETRVAVEPDVEYAVRLEIEGFALAQARATAAAGREERLDLALAATGRAVLTVLLPDGSRALRADVLLSGPDGARGERCSAPDTWDLAPGRWEAEARLEGFEPSEPLPIDIAAGATVTATLRLREKAGFSGVLEVAIPDAPPFLGVQAKGPGKAFAVARRGPDGTAVARLPGLAPGRYHVSARFLGKFGEADADVASGTTRITLVLKDTAPKAGRVRGRVLEADGATPAAGARILTALPRDGRAPAFATADASGAFGLEVPPGECDFAVNFPPGCATRRHVIVPEGGEVALEIVLAKPGTIAGRVTGDAEIARRTIALVLPPGASLDAIERGVERPRLDSSPAWLGPRVFRPEEPHPVAISADGTFRAEPLSPDEYAACLYDPDEQRIIRGSLREHVVVGAGVETPLTLEARDAPGTGRVVFRTQERARCFLRGADGRERDVPWRDGACVAREVPPGSYTAGVRAELAARVAAIEVAPDAEVAVALEPPVGLARLVCRFTGPAPFRIDVRGAGGIEVSGLVTGEQGSRLEFVSLPPGPYRAFAIDMAGEQVSEEAAVDLPDELRAVEVELRPLSR
jgi:hypothetical protein